MAKSTKDAQVRATDPSNQTSPSRIATLRANKVNNDNCKEAFAELGGTKEGLSGKIDKMRAARSSSDDKCKEAFAETEFLAKAETFETLTQNMVILSDSILIVPQESLLGELPDLSASSPI